MTAPDTTALSRHVGFGISVHASDELLDDAWIGFDLAGRIVVTGQGAQSKRFSNEPVARIVCGAAMHTALLPRLVSAPKRTQ